MQKYVYLHFVTYFGKMRQDAITQLGSTPFTLEVLSAVYPNCKQITDKARRLEQEGRILRLKRGLYVRSAADGATPDTHLMANHIYGPSYVSLRSALRYHGLVPERVVATESMCLKHSRSFDTPFGRFIYHACSNPYFALGIQMQSAGTGHCLIATPEKALCDLMTVTPGIAFRNSKKLVTYLEQDLRIDTDMLRDFSLGLIRHIHESATVKPQNIATLIKLLQ